MLCKKRFKSDQHRDSIEKNSFDNDTLSLFSVDERII